MFGFLCGFCQQNPMNKWKIMKFTYENNILDDLYVVELVCQFRMAAQFHFDVIGMIFILLFVLLFMYTCVLLFDCEVLFSTDDVNF